MADLPPHREDRISGSRFPPLCASWNTTAPSIPQGSLSSGPPRHYAGAQQNTMSLPVNPTLGQIGGDREATSVQVVTAVAQGRPQHPNPIDFVHYHPPSLADLTAPYMYHNVMVGNNNHARVIQGVPPHAQVIAPPVPEIQEHDIFDDVAQHPPVGIAPSGINAWPHEVPAASETAAEILRQLASRYSDHPNSQVDMVRVELSPGGGGFRVVIALEIQVGAPL